MGTSVKMLPKQPPACTLVESHDSLLFWSHGLLGIRKQSAPSWCIACAAAKLKGVVLKTWLGFDNNGSSKDRIRNGVQLVVAWRVH